MGVNAHVNNDLPLSLNATASDNFYIDFLKVNQIISKILNEVILSLNEKSFYLKFTQKIFLPIYSFVLILLIKNWRNNAWQDYTLKNDDLNKKKCNVDSKNIALKLFEIKNLFQIPKLYRVWRKI